MVDDVARALCDAAGKSCNGAQCTCCEHEEGKPPVCVYWQSFRDEAKAAIFAVYKWHKKERRWPSFVKDRK